MGVFLTFGEMGLEKKRKPGGKAAAAATRHLDYSEINNLVKSQDRAGAREGAPGETSTTTRAEKKRKPVSLVHQAPAGWFSAL